MEENKSLVYLEAFRFDDSKPFSMALDLHLLLLLLLLPDRRWIITEP